MRKFYLRFLTLASGLFFVLYGFTMVSAKEAAKEEFTLEEITITAEKREENLQKTALSITAITGDSIQDKGLNTIDEALKNIPALQVGGMTFGGSPFIRGVGSNSSADSVYMSVNMNIDGVYQRNTRQVYQSIYDISRIEVLRGPQGTLYGRNATAGSINIVTSEVVNEFEASGSVDIGSYDEVRTEGMVNVPVNNKLALRLAFSNERHDGYLSNGNMNADNSGVRFKARYQASDKLNIIATFENKIDKSVPGTVPLNSTHPEDPWYSDHVQGITEKMTVTYSLDVDYNLGWGTLKILPSYAKSDNYENIQMIAPIGAQGGIQEQITVETRLSSPAESTVKWVGGLFYMKQENETPTVINRLSSDTWPTNPNARVTNQIDVPYSNWAAFGQVTYPLSDRFRLTGGARYTRDIRDLNYRVTVEATGYDSGALHLQGNYSKATYKAGLEYDVNDASMLYGAISTGYNTGGYMLSEPPAEYKPEELTSYSIGSKNRFLNNRLQINAEAFLYDYKNYQVGYMGINPVSGVTMSLRANAASTTTYGMELENDLLITQNDRLKLSVAYLHAKFNDFVYDEVAFGGFIHRDFSGDTVPNSPEWSGTLGYEHYWALNNGGQLSLEGSFHYSTEYFTSFETYLPGSTQESYHKSDAYLGYYSSDGKWNARLYCKNIENDPQRIYAMPNNRVTITAPRTYGIKYSVSF